MGDAGILNRGKYTISSGSSGRRVTVPEPSRSMFSLISRMSTVYNVDTCDYTLCSYIYFT